MAGRFGHGLTGACLLVGLSLFFCPLIPSAVAKAASAPSGSLLSGNQSTFEHSDGGWSGKSAVAIWTSAVGADDPGALEISPTGAPPVWGSAQSISAWSSLPGAAAGNGGLTAATPGLVYEGSAEVMPAETSSITDHVDAALGFWSQSGTPLAFEPATVDTVAGGFWSATSTAVAIAPPGTAYVALGVIEWGTTGSGDLYVDDAELVSLQDDPSSVAGPLHTVGTQIIDSTGHPVVLRGIAYAGLAFAASSPDLTEQTFANLHAWGATMVRFFLNEDLWDPQSCAYVPNYQTAVQQAVSWTTSLGMVALLTLQAGTPQDIEASGSCPTQPLQNMADNPGSDDFWSSAAATFKSNPLVAFDLFNEPNGISSAEWLNGGPQDGFAGQGMQQLYNDVRRSGASNLVFVEGDNWASTPPLPGELVQGYNVVYDVHYYTCPHAAPPQCGYAGDPYDPSGGLGPWAVFQSQEDVPVFVGEFGWPSTSDGTYNGNVINFAATHGWGWAAYIYDPWTGDPFDLVSTTASTVPFEPSPSGMPVLADMAQASSPSSSPPPPSPSPAASGPPHGQGSSAPTRAPAGVPSGLGRHLGGSAATAGPDFKQGAVLGPGGPDLRLHQAPLRKASSSVTLSRLIGWASWSGGAGIWPWPLAAVCRRRRRGSDHAPAPVDGFLFA